MHNYSLILYQFLTFTQNLKQSLDWLPRLSKKTSAPPSLLWQDNLLKNKHYMKIDHTLCFLQYFILRIYHCNEYAYLPNP